MWGDTPFLANKERIIAACRHVARDSHHFQKIEIPILDHRGLYEKSLGADSDVVNKELFCVENMNARPDSRATHATVLRPEGTAGVARSFLSNSGWFDLRVPFRVWYEGPMFRGERPSKARFRQVSINERKVSGPVDLDSQFDQFGVEVFGEDHVITDAECIQMGFKVLERLGLGGRVEVGLVTVRARESNGT